MKISIISSSHRKNSESARVGDIFKTFIAKIDKDINCFSLDMFKSKIPLWPAEKNKIMNIRTIVFKNFFRIKFF